MCSIIGSHNKGRIRELAELNAYRGQHSHSVYVFSKYTNQLLYNHKGLGPLNIDDHDLPEGYIICHQQAPTTDNKDLSSVHPAQIGDELLWHNGIIKAHEIKRLQNYLESNISWDTKLLLQYLVNEDTEALHCIDGTFSCVWYDGFNLMLFRNDISPMFIDMYANISSTKFDGSKSVSPNKVWLFNNTAPIINEMLELCSTFETVDNPYFGLDL
jgi:asparagine synthetase B (glutamine-hydrolysing)